MQVGEQQTKEQEERYKFLQQENKKINFPEFMLQQKRSMRDTKARIWRVYKEKVSKFIMQSKQKRRQYNLKDMKKKQLEDWRKLLKLQIKRGC